jgi:PRC-barrel domain
METGSDIYTYRDESITGLDLIGYSVEATDGSIGKIDDATNEVGASYIVVDTGPWIFGKHVLLPAGVIERVDQGSETVYVNRTKEEIKNSPEWDDERGVDETYRSQVGGYYTTRD